MTVNYLGTVHTLQAALPGMLERRQGRVVVVASALAVLGFAGVRGAGGAGLGGCGRVVGGNCLLACLPVGWVPLDGG